MFWEAQVRQKAGACQRQQKKVAKLTRPLSAHELTALAVLVFR
jgi:hypothetical protein